MGSIKGKKLVFVGMSGGVDSSVAALLLKKEGYDVVGIFIRSFNIDGCQDKDAEDARRVAEHIGIPFYVWDFEKEYKERVVNYMIEGYRNGITPNPDVMCNKEIKFGLFFDRARKLGAEYVATGHYARLVSGVKSQVSRESKDYTTSASFSQKETSFYGLKVARDAQKDQSYFLWTLTQKQLRHCLFPIGDYEKPEVRRIAKEAGLPTAEKKDSQGICFIGKFTLSDFLKEYIPEKRGAVVTTNGELLGEHEGAYFYTIGQRHIGMKQVSGVRGSSFAKATADKQVSGNKEHKDRRPFYVAEKNLATNTLVVAEGNENPELFRKEIELRDVNFIRSLQFASGQLAVLARVRYRQPLAAARLSIQYPVSSIKYGKKDLMPNTKYAILNFDRPQKFVAPGQSAVFYTEEGEMLGGGVIV